MPQRKFFVVTGIIVFDFELFIGERDDFLIAIKVAGPARVSVIWAVSRGA